MKVNISYTVELENVPSEVYKLLTYCVHMCANVHADLSILEVENIVETITEMKEIREQISTMGLRIDDCINILAGYLDVKSSLEFQEHKPSEENNVE